jgi:AraC family transcriptional regulator
VRVHGKTAKPVSHSRRVLTVIPATKMKLESVSAGFELSEGVYPAGLRLKFNTEEDAYFCFVLEGSVTEATPDRTVTHGAGKQLFFPLGRAYVVDFEKSSHCLIVRIGAELLRRFELDREKLSKVVCLQDWEATWLAKRLQAEFVKHNPGRELVMEAALLQLLALTVRSQRLKRTVAESFWLKKVRTYLDNEYLRDFRLTDLAELAGVHRVHLVREFRRHYGMTIGQHIRKLRIEHACNLLARSDLLLRDIAEICRFVDQSHFSKQFKRMSGLTPAEYRNLVKTAEIRAQYHPSTTNSSDRTRMYEYA